VKDEWDEREATLAVRSRKNGDKTQCLITLRASSTPWVKEVVPFQYRIDKGEKISGSNFAVTDDMEWLWFDGPTATAFLRWLTKGEELQVVVMVLHWQPKLFTFQIAGALEAVTPIWKTYGLSIRRHRRRSN
jgi:hypothetical protein